MEAVPEDRKTDEFSSLQLLANQSAEHQNDGSIIIQLAEGEDATNLVYIDEFGRVIQPTTTSTDNYIPEAGMLLFIPK